MRNALVWSKYRSETINLWGGEAQVLFAQHHWPVWHDTGDEVRAYLRKRRDLYRDLNDQTLRLLNKGYTGIEFAEKFVLPLGLEQSFDLRGDYGTDCRLGSPRPRGGALRSRLVRARSPGCGAACSGPVREGLPEC